MALLGAEKLLFVIAAPLRSAPMPGNEQQRSRDVRATARHTMVNGPALVGVEGLQRSVGHAARP